MRNVITPLVALLLGCAPAVQALDAQGHRGARGLLPENTLAAFARALDIGVDTLEMDLGVTRDGHVVVMHDRRLNPDLTRDRSGAWLTVEPAPAVSGLTLAELHTYDVGRIRPGSRYATRYLDQQPVDGARVPTLADVFALAGRAGNDRVRFNIETKIDPNEPALTPGPEAFARAVIAVVEAHQLSERVSIQSFDWRTLRHTRERAPTITRVHLSAQQHWLDTIEAGRPGPSPWTAGYDIDDFDGDLPRMVKAAGGDVWSPFHGDVDAAIIARAKSLGLRVVVWTVNEQARMRELIDMGVDGIISDYPDRLMEVLGRR